MDIKNEDIDLSNVVHAVRESSDNELRVLAKICDKIDNKKNTGNIICSESSTDDVISKPSKKGEEKEVEGAAKKSRRNIRNKRQNITTRSGEVEINVPSLRNSIDSSVSENAEQTAFFSNRNEKKSSINDELSKAQTKEADNQLNHNKPHSESASLTPIVNVESQGPESINTTLDASTLDNLPDQVEQAVQSGMGSFEGFWRDERGRLRRQNGAFASKEEQNQYQESSADIAQSREQERQSSVLVKLASGFKESMTNSEGHGNDATDAAGIAGGGSWFYAMQELYDLGGSVADMADQSSDKISGASDKFSSIKDRLLRRSTSSTSTESVADTSDVEPRPTESLNSINTDNNQSEEKNTSSELLSVLVNNEPSEKHSRTDSNTTSQEVFNGAQQSALVTSNNHNTQSVYEQSSAETTNNSKEKSTASTMQKSDAERLELVKEQTSEQLKANARIIQLLDDIERATSASNSQDGGIFSDIASIGDMFGSGDGSDTGRGRNKRGSRGRGKFTSVLSGATDSLQSVGGKGMTMAGTAFKGISTIAKGAAKAVPLLAPALMAYDAFTGFTDTEKQKETFGLKDGQEATLGQKSSLALASVLDMGGLISGGAGLIGSGLGLLGFEGAKEALNFDSGDMAKGIYSFFGGESSTNEEKRNKTKNASDSSESSESANQPKQAHQFSAKDELGFKEDAQNEARLQQGATVESRQELRDRNLKESSAFVAETNAYAKEHGVDYQEAYQLKKEQQHKKQQEQKAVAAEMGQPIDGRVEGSALVSPKKQAAQLSLVDQEIARRRETENTTNHQNYTETRANKSLGSEQVASIVTSTIDDQATAKNTKIDTELSDKSIELVQASSKITGNESVNTLMAQQRAADLKNDGKTNEVELNKKSVDALSRAISASSSSQTTIVKTSQKSSVSNSAPSRSATSIPTNFSDRSLQRQSADLE